MSFIIENATPLLIGVGILWGLGLVVIWSCLAMSKRSEGEG